MAVADLIETLTESLTPLEDFEEQIAREFAEIDQVLFEMRFKLNSGTIAVSA